MMLAFPLTAAWPCTNGEALMTESSCYLDAAELLHSAFDFCIEVSKYIFRTLEITTTTDTPKWDLIRSMTLAICEGHASQVLHPLIPDDEQRRPIARGLALGALEGAAKSIGRQWP
jgi:hypothetical protein